MADRTGQELGNYRLVSLLGRGGFAEVYLGEHMRLKTKAAIKVLYTQLEGDDTENFLTEAQTVAHLVHPNIVRIFDFDVKEGVPFLVMDYAANGNLRQRHPKNTRLPLETIVSYIKQVADALQYAHDEKLIHRDIKPENMLLGRRNEVLLSDFGIALIAQSTRMQSTQDVVGTAYYMAPEQLQGKPRLASDQYALGIVVYEWLSGNRPFHGSFSEIASQHMFVPPPSLHEKIPSISPAIEEVVMTALTKDPRQRFGSVRAFANALEQASQSTRTSSRGTPPGQPSVQPGSATPPGQPLVQSGQQPIILQSGPITSPSQSRPQPITSPPLSQFLPSVGKQAEVVSTNSNPSSQSAALPPRLSGSGSSPHQKANTIQPTKRATSRRAVLIGLAGLVVVGGGSITWLTLSQQASSTANHSNNSSFPGPNLAQAYSGTFDSDINNAGVEARSTMTLSSIVQTQDQISGDLKIDPPFAQAGHFTGSVTTYGTVDFTTETTSLNFNAYILSDGSMTGICYKLPDKSQVGTWQVNPA